MPGSHQARRSSASAEHVALFGGMAMVGHAVGLVADVYSGYSSNVAVELGPVTALSLEHIGPFLEANTLGDAVTGHYLAVLFIPLGIFGVWQVAAALRPAAQSLWFLVLGTLCVAYGTFYHGTLAFLTGALHVSQPGPVSGQGQIDLVAYFDTLSYPFGVALLLGNVAVSALFAFAVALRNTRFPRWFASVNPVLIQLLLSALIVVAPRPVDQLLWLTVFNASFLVWYAATTAYLLRGQGSDPPEARHRGSEPGAQADHE